MNDYADDHKLYIAPYTTLITSSMMGKTRLMKEMSRHIPSVYICLRKAGSSGYPLRTPTLADWIESGVITQHDFRRPRIMHDYPFYLPTLKFAALLHSLMGELTLLAGNNDLFERRRSTRDPSTFNLVCFERSLRDGFLQIRSSL